jgi:hypothetical protein
MNNEQERLVAVLKGSFLAKHMPSFWEKYVAEKQKGEDNK